MKPSFTIIVPLLCATLLASPLARAAELKPETATAFAKYLEASDRRTQSELRNGPFLLIDQFPSDRRSAAYNQLRAGAVLVQPVSTTSQGRPIEVPRALIHHWVAVLFIPHTSLAHCLSVLQDYPNYQNIYRPEIRNSKLLSRNGDNFKVSLQLYKKSLIPLAINADLDIDYQLLGATRAVIRSRSTRLVEVQHAAQPGERELSPSESHGFVWRLCDYWRLEEKDGGVYVQFESIVLSRGVPAFIGWLVNPMLRSVPRGTLVDLLTATRKAIAPAQPAAAKEASAKSSLEPANDI